MDGTLIPLGSSWELLHRRFGTYEVTRRHMEMFFRGEISYRQWAEMDVSLWVGRRVDEALDGVNIEPFEGAEELIAELKSMGVITGMISSGLDVIARRVASRLRMDFWISGELEIRNGVIIGLRRAISPEDKVKYLMSAAERYGVSKDRVAFIGDDFSDIYVFKSDIGLKIAFKPRNEEIAKLAHVVAGSYEEVREAVMAWLLK